MKTKVIIWTVAILFAATVAASAATSQLTASGTSWELQLDSSYVPDAGAYDYTYTLTNTTQSDYIVGFSLNLAVNGVTNIVSPTGWGALELNSGSGEYIEWQSSSPSTVSLAPGSQAVFGFTSIYASVVNNTLAGAQDDYGYGGTTSGPAVPEPGSIVALCCGLVGLMGLKRRSKR